MARRARMLHESGQPFQVRLISGASTGAAVDDELAQADAISSRAPYLTSIPLRDRVNAGKVDFVDMHLSHVSQMVLEGFLGRSISRSSKPRRSLPMARSTSRPASARTNVSPVCPAGHHRAQSTPLAPAARDGRHRRAASSTSSAARLRSKIRSTRSAADSPASIRQRSSALCTTTSRMEAACFTAPDGVSHRIADHVAGFLLAEMAAGRIPKEFLPLQSGVGNVCNAVMAGLAACEELPRFNVYTEVLQDATFDLLAAGAVSGASRCSLSLSEEKLKFLYDNFDELADWVVLRPQEISNNRVARQLGVIAMNTAIEVDIYGHANSTHFFGTQVMNGLGGSGDFERNSFLSILMCPSVVKGGRISTVVPMCSHVDHSEHSVQVIVTEQGLPISGPLADCTGEADHRPVRPPRLPRLLTPLRRTAPRRGHLRHDLRRCFELYTHYLETGSMLPDLDLSQFDS